MQVTHMSDGQKYKNLVNKNKFKKKEGNKNIN